MGLGFGRSQLACHPLSEPQFPFLDEMKCFEAAEGSHPVQRRLSQSPVRPPPAARLQRSFSAERRRPLLERDGRTALALAASGVSRWLPGGWAVPPGLEPRAGTETSGWQEIQIHKDTDTFQGHPKTWAQYHPRSSHGSRSTEKQGAEDGRRCAEFAHMDHSRDSYVCLGGPSWCVRTRKRVGCINTW